LFGHIRNDAAYVGAVKSKMAARAKEKQLDGWVARSIEAFFGRA